MSYYWLIGIPFIAGFLCLISPRILREFWAVLGSLVTFVMTALVFSGKLTLLYNIHFGIDNLNRFFLPATGLFGFRASNFESYSGFAQLEWGI